MTYRDEHEALRARLAATEQRLRETEDELAQAKRRLDEPASLEPSTPPPASRRVGHPPPAAVDLGMARSFLGAGGVLVALIGLGFVLWNLPAAEHLGDVGAILLFALSIFFVPGGLLVFASLRRPRRAAPVTAFPLRTRVATAHPAHVGGAEDAHAEAEARAEAEAEAHAEARAQARDLRIS
jgi:hypothetical protein